MLLEVVDPVARASDIGEPAWLSERGAEVLHDVPFRRFRLVIAQAIDAVVARLEVPVVQDEADGNEPLKRPGSGKRVLEPGPLAVRFVVGLQAESRWLALFLELARELP